jgi:acetate---CoA ligase (ADP-forming) subunit beta
MQEPQQIIESALKEGRKTLSEYESKCVLSHYGIPIAKERLCKDAKELKKASQELGYPLVLKGNSPDIAHKTEKGLIRLDIRNESEAEKAFEEIMGQINGSKGAVLVQEMVQGKRELLAGLMRDPQFGPCVSFGLGGIFTEVMKDVSFRIAPFDRREALEMMEETKAHKMLEAFRGMEAADKNILADILVKLGQIGMEQDKIKEIDINPLIISGAKPIAVDALIVLGD